MQEFEGCFPAVKLLELVDQLPEGEFSSRGVKLAKLNGGVDENLFVEVAFLEAIGSIIKFLPDILTEDLSRLL